MEDDNVSSVPLLAPQSELEVQKKRRGKRNPKGLHASPCGVRCKRVRSVNEDSMGIPLQRTPVQATQLDNQDKELIAGLVTRVEKMEATLLEILAKLNATPNFSSGFFFVPNNFVHEMRAPVAMRGGSFGGEYVEYAGNSQAGVRQRSDISAGAMGHARADIQDGTSAEQVQHDSISMPAVGKSTRSSNYGVSSGASDYIAEHVKRPSSSGLMVNNDVSNRSVYQPGIATANHVNHGSSSWPVVNAGVSSSYVYQSRSPVVAGTHNAGHMQHPGPVVNTILSDDEYQLGVSMGTDNYVEQDGNEAEGSEREASKSDSEGDSSNESIEGSEESEEDKGLPGLQEISKTENSEFVVNGINVADIASRNAYNYALRLMDVFFTKEEMAVSLLFKSKKSDKPALEKEKVEKLLLCVEKRYGKEWDLKTLTAKANQKCRDSRDSLIIRSVETV